METDPELNALSICLASLNTLDATAQKRCLDWLAKKLNVSPPAGIATAPENTPGQTVDASIANNIEADNSKLPPDAAKAFEQARPTSNAEKALVVAWFLSKVKGDSELSGQSINTELKHLGHGVTHITDTIQQLADSKPALMIQTRKSGTSRQARKTYKLTEEGAKAVLALRSKPMAT